MSDAILNINCKKIGKLNIMQVNERDVDKVIVRNIQDNFEFRNWLVRKFTKLSVFPCELIEAKRSVRDPKLGETDVFFRIRVMNPEWSDKVKSIWENKYYLYKGPFRESINTVAFLLENKMIAGHQKIRVRDMKNEVKKVLVKNNGVTSVLD